MIYDEAMNERYEEDTIGRDFNAMTVLWGMERIW